MPELHRIDEQVTIINHTVWVRPATDDDWKRLRDDSWPDKLFAPNLLCVIVAESHGQCHATWAQAREEHSGEGWTRCDGTQVRVDRYGTPDWWQDAEEFAVQVIRKQSKEAHGGRNPQEPSPDA